MTIARLPDGTELQFPDNTPDDVIQRVVKEQLGISNAQAPTQPQASAQPATQPEKQAPSFTDNFFNLSKGLEGVTAEGLGRQTALGGRYLAEGLSSIADLPNFAVNSIGQAFGANPNLQYPSDMVGSALTQLGVPQPQTPEERVVGDVSRAVAGTLGTASAARGLSSAAPSLAALAENPLLQARTAAGAAAAGGTAREMGADPLIQLGANLAGGYAAGRGAIPKKEVYSSNEIRNQANQAYRKAAEKGGAIKPEYASKIFDEVESKLFDNRVTMSSTKYKPVKAEIDFVRKLAKQPITLKEAQTLDSDLGDTISSFIEPSGRPNKVGEMLMQVRDAFRDSIENAGEEALIGGKDGFKAWKEGRSLWSKSLKLGDVERIILHAEGRDNPVTVIRHGFAAIRDNPKRMATYSKEEQAAIKHAAKTGIIAQTLRFPGSRLIPIVAAGSGSPVAGAGAALSALGARSVRDALQTKRALKVAEAIAGTKPRDLQSPLLAITAGTAQGINNTR